MDTKKLRQKILDLAIRGKLVPQDPNDEPASVLLERIRAEKEQLIKEGKIKRSKKSAATDKSHYENVPFEIPESWCWTTLGELCSIKGGKRLPKGKSFADTITPHIYIRVTDMKDHTVLLSSLKYIDEDVFAEIKNYTISSNDLYLTIAGTIGDVGFVPAELDGANLTENAAKLTDIKCSKQYLMYVLMSSIAQDHFCSRFHQVAQPKLSLETASSTLIPLPPYREQLRIAEELDRWLGVVVSVEDDLSELTNYVRKTKSKILDLAISGKLVPQDLDNEPAIELLKRINPGFEPCDNSHYGNLPQGWTVCRLEDILDYEQPQAYIVNSTDYSDEYETPVLTAGKSFIIGYTNETNGICDRLPVIIFDDFTTDSKLVDFPFKVKSSAMKILRTKGEININYIAYYMSITRLIGDTHKRYWISEYSKLLIPIPPYQEQLRIVETVETIFNEILKITAELS